MKAILKMLCAVQLASEGQVNLKSDETKYHKQQVTDASSQYAKRETKLLHYTNQGSGMQTSVREHWEL